MDKEDETGRGRLLRYGALVLIAAVAITGAVLLRDQLTFEALAANRDDLIAFRDRNYLSAAAGFVFAYALIVAFSLPGATIATLTGGFLFGVFPGVFLNVVGATLGATAIFTAAKWGLGAQLAARMDASEGLVRRLKQGIDRNMWEVLFLIRLVPAVPFFVANIVPALVGVRLLPFVVTTFLGIMPGALVFTSVGNGLGAVFERGGRPDLSILFEPQILLPIIGLCALALLPIILKSVRGTKGV
ncbi:VTT domain-containing protein [Roseicyclus sp. F158]|uniref:TVP38/TMEM64 family membrane protein n=1 Tax=Tropicimonas omnivorans TaxID=3075590 RepID=A0ABU3DEZ7_9RHOB|nr:VTT domain-containing protein [Roseicyclus sp. F158]MDT0682295.1 VTT domain-containing protein [Roseicyclus sp. F158]